MLFLLLPLVRGINVHADYYLVRCQQEDTFLQQGVEFGKGKGSKESYLCFHEERFKTYTQGVNLKKGCTLSRGVVFKAYAVHPIFNSDTPR